MLNIDQTDMQYNNETIVLSCKYCKMVGSTVQYIHILIFTEPQLSFVPPHLLPGFLAIHPSNPQWHNYEKVGKQYWNTRKQILLPKRENLVTLSL